MPSVTTTVRRSRDRPAKPRPAMALHRARVTRAVQLSPNVRRITFVGEGLAAMPYAGPDQRVKLLLPLAGQRRPHVGDVVTIADFLALPADVRAVMRTYTIRYHRPGASEIDIDFAQHGELGPASHWAAAAAPGDEVAIYGPASDYELPEKAQWQLIVGDESALPAIGAIVESLRFSQRARVFVEIADRRDEQSFETAADVEISWLHRGATPAHESQLLLDAVRSSAIPDIHGYFWLAGESSVVTALRRHLVNERGVHRRQVNFTGYWRHGRTENDL